MTEDDARKIAMLVIRFGEACANSNDDADEELYDQIVTRLSALAKQPQPSTITVQQTKPIWETVAEIGASAPDEAWAEVGKVATVAPEEHQRIESGERAT